MKREEKASFSIIKMCDNYFSFDIRNWCNGSK